MSSHTKFISIIENHIMQLLMSSHAPTAAITCTMMKSIIDEIKEYPSTVSWFGKLARTIICPAHGYVYKEYQELIEYMYKTGWHPYVQKKDKHVFLELLYNSKSIVLPNDVLLFPNTYRAFWHAPIIQVEQHDDMITSITDIEDKTCFKIGDIFQNDYKITKITTIISHYFFMFELDKLKDPESTSNNDAILLSKYRKFIDDLTNIIDIEHSDMSDKEKVAQELMDCIEHDCLDLANLIKWMSYEYVYEFRNRVIY